MYHMKLALLAKSLEGNSPLKKLESGFAYVETSQKSRLTSVNDAKAGELLFIHLQDGKIITEIKEVNKHE